MIRRRLWVSKDTQFHNLHCNTRIKQLPTTTKANNSLDFSHAFPTWMSPSPWQHFFSSSSFGVSSYQVKIFTIHVCVSGCILLVGKFGLKTCSDSPESTRLCMSSSHSICMCGQIWPCSRPDSLFHWLSDLPSQSRVSELLNWDLSQYAISSNILAAWVITWSVVSYRNTLGGILFNWLWPKEHWQLVLTMYLCTWRKKVVLQLLGLLANIYVQKC